MPDSWKTKASRYLVERWWMNLREDHVILPSGVELEEYHVLELPDWVCVVCICEEVAADEQSLVLVRQYRYAAGRAMLELPAGAIDPGENPIEAGRRELREETGFDSASIASLPPLYGDPSRLTNRGHILVASGARRVSQPKPEAGEDIEVVIVPSSEILQLVARGELAHATHVAAILLAARSGSLDLT